MQEKQNPVSPSPERQTASRHTCEHASLCHRDREMSHNRRLERQLDAIQEISGIVYWVFDMFSGRISWSRQIFSLLKHADTSGFPDFHEFLAFYMPEDSLLFRKSLVLAVRDRKKQEFEMHASLSNGEAAWHRCTMIPDTDGDEEILAVLGYLQDITAGCRHGQDHPKPVQDTALVGRQSLSGLLPICSHCKKVRDDQGAWKQIETYLTERSNLFFSHGICPECLTIHYSEYFPLGVSTMHDTEE